MLSCRLARGPDPRPLATRFLRLDVLLETDGEHDAEPAADVGRIGQGLVHHHREVAPALNRMLSRCI